MARNPVQFQKGMSLAAFQAEYGGKESYEAALRAQRWPQDFVCPKCQGRKHSYCVRRRLYQCSAQNHRKCTAVFIQDAQSFSSKVHTHFHESAHSGSGSADAREG